MKKSVISMLLLFGAATSVAFAQKQIKIEYDSGGNVIKCHSPQKTLRVDLDNQFAVKVYPSPTTGPLNIRVFEGRSGAILTCKIQLIVLSTATSGSQVMNKTFSNGDINIDLSNSPNGVYGLYLLVFVDPQKPIMSKTIQILKKS